MTTDNFELRASITYATHDGVTLAGDLYLPKGAGPFPALVAAEILPAGAALDSAAAVNSMLTRVARCMLDARLSPRHASAAVPAGRPTRNRTQTRRPSAPSA